MSLYNGECRASKVNVLEIQDIEGNVLPDAVAISMNDGKTRYIPGQTVEIDNFGTSLYESYLPGIYFYPDRKVAVYYMTKGADVKGNPIPITLEELRDGFKSGEIKMGTPVNVWDNWKEGFAP